MSESEIFHLTAEGRLAALQRENEDLRLRLSRLQLAEDKRAEIANHDREIANLRRALHRSEARYRLIVESAVDYAIIATDLDGTVTTWNEAAETTLGWSAEQMIGRPIKTIFTREDVANGIHEREMRLSLTEGKARDERWHLRANGSRFFASGEMMPLLDDDEQPAGFLKILRDRTQEVLERKELDASRERLRLALDASAIVGTFDWDVPADILFADQRFAAIFGRVCPSPPFSTAFIPKIGPASAQSSKRRWRARTSSPRSSAARPPMDRSAGSSPEAAASTTPPAARSAFPGLSSTSPPRRSAIAARPPF